MRIHKKLKRSQAGFTLAETLIAILILLMVSAIVAGAIPTASNVYVKTVDAANAQVVLSTAVTALRDELGTATIKKVDASEKSIIYRGKFGWSKLEFGDFTTTTNSTPPETRTVTGIRVTYGGTETYNDTTKKYEYTFPTGDDAAKKQYFLVSERAITKNLKIECVGADGVSPITWSGGVLTFSGFRVSKDGNPLAEETFKIRVVS